MKQREEKNSAPKCPFCGSYLKRPETMTLTTADIVQGGTCSCGALYLVDPTGKNVGLMMAQALNEAAEMQKKGVGELTPDEDYQDAVLSYDVRNHRSTGINQGYMDGMGRLYIIKIGKQQS